MLGVSDEIDIQMGTLGKALGSFGAYVAGSREMIEYLVNSSRSFIFSTSLPPAVLAASVAALDIAASAEGAALRSRLEANRRLFTGILEGAGVNTLASPTQIIPIMVGGAAETMNFSQALLDEGIFVQGIRPPTVPAGSCRLRATIMAVHREEDLKSAADTIISVGRKLGIL
jgi:glycine C-acetyltransferase